MRYRLRTLLIVAALGPPAMAVLWFGPWVTATTTASLTRHAHLGGDVGPTPALVQDTLDDQTSTVLGQTGVTVDHESLVQPPRPSVRTPAPSPTSWPSTPSRRYTIEINTIAPDGP